VFRINSASTVDLLPSFLVMFSAGEIAKSIHAVAQCIQTIRAGNSSAEDDSAKPKAAPPPGLMGSSAVSGIILSQPHQSASNVSVVSSSMDFCEAPESALLPPPATRPSPDRVTPREANFRTALKREEPPPAETKPAAVWPPSKKMRLADAPPEARTAAAAEHIRTLTTPSFEQAAIVAALEQLYGKGAAGGGVKKHGDISSSGTFTEASVAANFRKETSPSPSSLPPKKFQHISRALLGTSSSNSFRSAGDMKNDADRSSSTMAMGPRPSMPPTFVPGPRPSSGTAAASNGLPGESKKLPSSHALSGKSPLSALPKKAPYLDAKPSAAKQTAKPDPEDDDENPTTEFEYNDSKYYSSKSPMVLQPSPYDVLLGRGKSNKNHPGNKRFQGKFRPM
jgi:hypothetical protein